MHRSSLPRLCAPLCLLFVSGCFHFDRNLSPGEIAGTAVYRSAQGALVPAAGAIVTIENSGGLTVTADSHGRFVLVGLPAGTFTLDATDSPGEGISEVGIRLVGLTLAAADGLDLGQVTLDTFGAIQGSVALDGAPIGPAQWRRLPGWRRRPWPMASSAFRRCCLVLTQCRSSIRTIRERS